MDEPQTSRPIADPQPGYFLIRLVRKGPHVPARIIRDERGWQVVIDGVPSPHGATPEQTPELFRVWTGGKMIDEAEYLRRMKTRRDALAPRARTPIDPNALPSPY